MKITPTFQSLSIYGHPSGCCCNCAEDGDRGGHPRSEALEATVDGGWQKTRRVNEEQEQGVQVEKQEEKPEEKQEKMQEEKVNDEEVDVSSKARAMANCKKGKVVFAT